LRKKKPKKSPAMPAPVQPMPGGGAPSTFDKMKLGAMMGGSVGLIIGFLFGGYNLVKHGPGPNGFVRSLGRYMLGSAATFGFFMSIGTAIRTQDTGAFGGERWRRPVVLAAVAEERWKKRREER